MRPPPAAGAARRLLPAFMGDPPGAARPPRPLLRPRAAPDGAPAAAYLSALQSLLADARDDDNAPQPDGTREDAVAFLATALGLPPSTAAALATRAFSWRLGPGGGRYRTDATPSVDALAARLEALTAAGLARDAVAAATSRHPSLLALPPAQVRLAASFLHSLGLSPDDVGVLAAAEPRVLSFSVQSMAPAAAALRAVGLDVARLAVAAPTVLGLSVERSLGPRLAALAREPALAPPGALAAAVMAAPTLLYGSTERLESSQAALDALDPTARSAAVRAAPGLLLAGGARLDAALAVLRDDAGLATNEAVSALLCKRPLLLRGALGATPTVAAASAWLSARLGGRVAVVAVAHRAPAVLHLSTEKLDDAWEWLVGAAGLALPPDRAARVAAGCPSLLGLTPANRDSKIAFLTDEIGMTRDQAAATICGMPTLVGLALPSLRARAAFLLGAGGRTPAEVSTFAPALASSLAGRLVPRLIVAARAGPRAPPAGRGRPPSARLSLSSLLAPTDTIFCERMRVSLEELEAVRRSDEVAAAVRAAEAVAARGPLNGDWAH